MTTIHTFNWTKANRSGTIQTLDSTGFEIRKTAAGVIVLEAGTALTESDGKPLAFSNVKAAKAGVEAIAAEAWAETPASDGADEAAAAINAIAAKAPAEAKATKKATRRTSVEKFDHCPKCGFAFTRPQAECKSPVACAKRQAAKAGAAK